MHGGSYYLTRTAPWRGGAGTGGRPHVRRPRLLALAADGVPQLLAEGKHNDVHLLAHLRASSAHALSRFRAREHEQ